ncbi:MAG: transposase [Muribaculaceae bacterium]|nr:transposase [Muribaculaceae bacterium]
MSKVVSLYHIVINTKNREMTIAAEHSEDIYRFITSIIKRNKCVLYRIGGIENHIHILVDLSPTVNLSHLMWDIKRSSSDWAKQSGLFPDFVGWGKEYAAFSVSTSHKDAVIAYIKRQREHHQQVGYDAELQRIAERNGAQWNETMLT